MFHLSLCVARYASCLNFYQSVFGAEIVPLRPGVANVMVFGGQLTLHDAPTTAMTDAARETMHFGAVVSRHEWQIARDRLSELGHSLRQCVEPTPTGRGKLVVVDPGGNLVELNTPFP